jgi:hypothetical protein
MNVLVEKLSSKLVVLQQQHVLKKEKKHKFLAQVILDNSIVLIQLIIVENTIQIVQIIVVEMDSVIMESVNVKLDLLEQIVLKLVLKKAAQITALEKELVIHLLEHANVVQIIQEMIVQNTLLKLNNVHKIVQTKEIVILAQENVLVIQIILEMIVHKKELSLNNVQIIAQIKDHAIL